MKPDYTIVSFSGGKDSTAMLLHMLEIGEHIDEVINVDTGMEFPAMYEHINQIEQVVIDHGVKFTRLKNEKTFEYMMLEIPIFSKKYGTHYGYGWPTPVIRWCTRHMKLDLIKKHLSELKDNYNLIQCVGLASDEFKRLERPNNNKPGQRHPLVEWGWSESDCLEYCKNYGVNDGWIKLYDLFNRVSCWCCPLSGINELRNLWKYYPDLWIKLLGYENYMESQTTSYYAKFRQEITVKDLTKRFIREDKAKRDQRTLDIFGGLA